MAGSMPRALPRAICAFEKWPAVAAGQTSCARASRRWRQNPWRSYSRERARKEANPVRVSEERLQLPSTRLDSASGTGTSSRISWSVFPGRDRMNPLTTRQLNRRLSRGSQMEN